MAPEPASELSQFERALFRFVNLPFALVVPTFVVLILSMAWGVMQMHTEVWRREVA